MALSDEEVDRIANRLVGDILVKIGAPVYVEPESVAQALKASMHEEEVAAGFYRRRAQYSEANGDEESAALWRHIADEEDNHYNEFEERLKKIDAFREFQRQQVAFQGLRNI